MEGEIMRLNIGQVLYILCILRLRLNLFYLKCYFTLRNSFFPQLQPPRCLQKSLQKCFKWIEETLPRASQNIWETRSQIMKRTEILRQQLKKVGFEFE
jgi:hypothetical protein